MAEDSSAWSLAEARFNQTSEAFVRQMLTLVVFVI